MAPSKDDISSSLLEDYLPLFVRHPLSSSTRTFANLVLCIVGVGVLGLPYSFSNVGYVMGILTLTVGGTLSYHGMMLQLYSKRRLQRSHGELDLIIASYGDLAFHAFGPSGRFFVDVLLTLGTFAGSIAHITFISHNLASIAASVQSTHIHGMQIQGMQIQGMQIQGLHSYSDLGIQSVSAVIPYATALNSTRHHNLRSSKLDLAKNPIVHNTSRIAHENFSFPGYKHQNQSSFKSICENQSFSESSVQNGSSLGSMSAYKSISKGSFVHKYLARIDWSSPTTYTWCIFPLIVVLGAVPSITSLAPLSTMGNVVNLAALAAVMVSDVLEIKAMVGFQNLKAFGNMVELPSAFGVGVYAFQATGIMIPIETAMEQPSELGSVLGVACTLIGLLYAMFAILGYAAFGTNTRQIITLNLQAGIEAMLIKVALSATMCLAFPLVLTPMFELVERRFSRRKRSLGLRALIVFLICLSATEVKQFAEFLSLSGSSIACLLCFIIPAAVHIKVMKEDGEKLPTYLLYVADYLLIAFGLIFGACGTMVFFLKSF